MAWAPSVKENSAVRSRITTIRTLIVFVVLFEAAICSAADYQINFDGVVADPHATPQNSRDPFLERYFALGTAVSGSLEFAVDFGPNLYAPDPTLGRWKTNSEGDPFWCRSTSKSGLHAGRVSRGARRYVR